MAKPLLKILVSGCMLSASLASAKDWQSGEIVSYQSFRYGAFEARMRGSVGEGAISAFFLLKEGSWVPGSEWQELDFEIFGKRGGRLFQSQIMTPGDPRTQNLVDHLQDRPLSEDFHTYRMEWRPDSLRFYFDGKLIREETDPKVYGKFLDPARCEDMRLRFSLWAGFSGWSGLVDPKAPPTPFYVDWVRVYSYEPAKKDFVFAWQDDFNGFDYGRWMKADWTFEYAFNDFKPGQVNTQGGQLEIKFTSY